MAEASGKAGGQKVKVTAIRTTKTGNVIRSRVTNIRNRAGQRRAGI